MGGLLLVREELLALGAPLLSRYDPWMCDLVLCHGKLPFLIARSGDDYMRSRYSHFCSEEHPNEL